MRIAILALVLLPGSAIAEVRDVALPLSHLTLPAAPKVAKAPRVLGAGCENPRTEYTVLTAGGRVRSGTLAQEPRAGLFLAVQRLEDGCDKPVRIADELGDKQR